MITLYCTTILEEDETLSVDSDTSSSDINESEEQQDENISINCSDVDVNVMSLKDISFSKADVFDACRKNAYDKIAFFLSSKKWKKPRTPLKFFRGNQESHWLVDYKDEKSNFTLLHYSAVDGFSEISKLLMDYEPLLLYCKSTKNILPIHLAAWNGYLDIVKMMTLHANDKAPELLNAVNIFNETPLHLAVQRGYIEIVQYLLHKGADPFIRNENKENVLDVAARIGVHQVIHLLCTKWPNFPVQSAYESLKTAFSDGKHPFHSIYPLHLSAKHNHVDCLKALRERGFALNYTTEDGTALHVAAACGQVDATKYLLEAGVNTAIKNQHGQNVLEMIISLQENRRPEIAQFIKNPEGWKECRAIIEGMDRRDSGRETEGSQSDTEREVIWHQLPPQASVRVFPDQRKTDQSIHRPPSISANLRDYSPEESPDTLNSVRSDCTYNSQTLNRTWNSQMYDKITGAPRFPITSPFNHSKHYSYQRSSDTLPTKLKNIRTRPSPPRTSVLPGKDSIYASPPTHPPRYDEWKKKQAMPQPYDNVPSSSAVANDYIGRSMSLKRNIGYSTLPKVSGLEISLNNAFLEDTAPNDIGMQKNQLFMSRTTCDREESLGLTQSPRLDTRASSVTSSLTYACSTLDKEKYAKESGRAPLAMPEEITGSVSGSVMFVSPEKENNVTAIFLNGDSRSNYSKTPESPPSPNTSKATIFDALCGKSGLAESSKNASLMSNSRGFSSPSTMSDSSQESPNFNKPFSVIEAGVEEKPVRIRRQNGQSNIRTNFQNYDSSSIPSSEPKSDTTSDDADWDKVTNLFETFGAAPCRGSVFEKVYGPRVAVYLRDRGSKALTLQMLEDAIKPDVNMIKQFDFPTTVAEWLETEALIEPHVAKHVGNLLEKYGYDRPEFLKQTITVYVLEDMRLEDHHKATIENALGRMPNVIINAADRYYVSDWLTDLQLHDYLANFLSASYKYMYMVTAVKWSARQLAEIGITLPGHAARILYSLKLAEDVKRVNPTPPALPPKAVQQEEKCAECPQVNLEKIRNGLVHGSIIFRAHQLGVCKVGETDNTDEAHVMMTRMKEEIKDWETIPRVTLEMRSDGLKIFDDRHQTLYGHYGVYTIRVVCQDRKDLNFFSFVARDTENHFYCYTFCVLTSSVATEIISTIGMMFEIRNRMDNNLPIDEAFIRCHHNRQ